MLKSGFISSAQIWPGSDMKIWLDSVLGGGGGGTEYNQANGYASQHHLVPIPSQENWQRCGRKSIRHKMGG